MGRTILKIARFFFTLVDISTQSASSCPQVYISTKGFSRDVVDEVRVELFKKYHVMNCHTFKVMRLENLEKQSETRKKFPTPFDGLSATSDEKQQEQNPFYWLSKAFAWIEFKSVNLTNKLLQRTIDRATSSHLYSFSIILQSYEL